MESNLLHVLETKWLVGLFARTSQLLTADASLRKLAYNDPSSLHHAEDLKPVPERRRRTGLSFRCPKQLLTTRSKSDTPFLNLLQKALVDVNSLYLIWSQCTGQVRAWLFWLLMGTAPKYILIKAQIRKLRAIIFFHPYRVTSEPMCVFPVLRPCPTIIY